MEPEYIYAIIRKENSDELNMISIKPELHPDRTETSIDKGVSNSLDYATDLCRPYSSKEPPYPKPENMDYTKWREGIVYKKRKRILAFLDTYQRVIDEYDYVAVSHRMGGFRCFEWEFNKDIRFDICTNFGYGSVSYFTSSVYYKEMKLAPYSLLLKYRYADCSEILSYTYNYYPVYENWKKVMKDALNFYNAIIKKDTHHIFQWIIHQLDTLTSGLERYVYATRINYDNLYPGGDKELVKDEHEVYEVKSFKISEALKFIDNIKKLPLQVNSMYYIEKIERVNQTLLQKIPNYQEKLKAMIQSLEVEKFNLDSKNLDEDKKYERSVEIDSLISKCNSTIISLESYRKDILKYFENKNKAA